MIVLHTVDMIFLFLGFGLRVVFFWAIERKVDERSKQMRIPLQIWVNTALMVEFVVPISAGIDVVLYAVAAPLMFVAALKWGDTIHDFYIYRRAGIEEEDRLPNLRGEWRNPP